jgi:hypothetical protein
MSVEDVTAYTVDRVLMDVDDNIALIVGDR